MRSADRLLIVTALAMLAGCTTIADTALSLKAAVTPSASAASAAAPAPAAAPAMAPPPPKVEAPPVNPNAQRAFDEAKRALAAGRVDEAERGFAALAQSNPELGGPHANLGLIYRNAGKNAEAVAALERAVQASPGQAVYFNQLGLAYRSSGQFGKARGAYERAIELDGAYAAPVLNLGILHDLYLNDPPRAMELYARYLTLAPGQEATVNKWMAELKNRKPGGAAPAKKEQS